MTGRNPWVVLGVAEDAPYHELQSAFRRRVKQTHPDSGGDAGEFATVVEAFDVVRRAVPASPRRVPAPPTPYDRWLRPHFQGRSWSSDRRAGQLATRGSGGPVTSRTMSRTRLDGGEFASVLQGEMTKVRATTANSTF